MHFSIAVALIALTSNVALALEIEFEGAPVLRLEMLEGTVQSQPVLPQRAREFAVKIVKTQTGYAWASRNNVAMTKIVSGVYITYVANTGAGYVRVYDPQMRAAIRSLPKDLRDKEFVYMEHIVNQLGSITYFGK